MGKTCKRQEKPHSKCEANNKIKSSREEPPPGNFFISVEKTLTFICQLSLTKITHQVSRAFDLKYRMIFYRNIYFRMNSTARIYMSRLIFFFFALPVITFNTT